MSENWPAGRMKCRKMSFLWNSGFPQFNCPPGTKHEILDILRGNIDLSIFVWYFDVIRRYSMIFKSSTYRGKIIRIPLPPCPAWELTIEFPLPSPRGCQKNNNRAGVILTCTYSTPAGYGNSITQSVAAAAAADRASKLPLCGNLITQGGG